MSIFANLEPQEHVVVTPKVMQAATLTAPRQFTIAPQNLPECAPQQILVRLQGCGVCASSLPVWEGREWFEYPLATGAPGHEGWGEVIKVGSEVEQFEVGQRVTCLGSNAFAEYVAVAEEEAVALPEALDDLPFPGEAIGCAMNIFARADIIHGQTITIVGAGFLGLLLVQLAVAAGARVIVVSRRESARDLAIQLGAELTFDCEDWWGNAHKIIKLTHGRGCDRVIEVTGLQFALDMATEIIGEYGKLVIGGFHQDGLRQINMQKWNWRGIDVINAHERARQRYVRGMKAGIAATLEGRITPHKLLTHSFSLAQVNHAFSLMLERPDGFIKGWIKL